MMKKLFFISILSCLLLAGCSEDAENFYGSIYGTVRNANTGAPIYNATISLTPGGRTTISGVDGTFEFQNLDAKQYSLNVSASGYSYNTRQVVITAGETTVCDMSLTLEPEIEGVRLSTSLLDFGSEYSSMSFTIYNTGNTPVDYWISGNIPGWLTIEPMSSTIAEGKSGSVDVAVERSMLTDDDETGFIIHAAGGTKSVRVKVSKGSGSNSDNSGSNSGSTSQNVTNGLYAYYMFENSYVNSVDGAPNGQGINEPSFTDGVKGSRALRLSVADNSYLNIPKAMIDGQTFTVSFWIKGLSDGHIFHIEIPRSFGYDDICAMKDGQLVLCSAYDWCYNYNTLSTFVHPKVSQDSWNMITLTSQSRSNGSNSCDVSLYINGEYVDIKHVNFNFVNEGLKFIFGGELDNITPPSMTIDNLRVYNSRALSAEEVKKIYNYER